MTAADVETGPDKKYDINIGILVPYAGMNPPNDPYYNSGSVGAPADTNNDGQLDHGDNITNHDLEAK